MQIEQVIAEIDKLKEIQIPEGRVFRRSLNRSLITADNENPLQIYVGSCPDYSHNSGLYTHKALGEGTPLLTQYHLETDTALLKILERFQMPYTYTIMVADVEATDKVFCRKFTKSCEEEFLRRCLGSIAATSESIKQLDVNGQLKSSSFFKEFGRDRFMETQEAYQEVLGKKYASDNSFRARVQDDLIHRIDLYRTMYPEVFEFSTLAKGGEDFLVSRTIRTMAQYLALGRLIGEQPNPLIINHPTRNLRMFNDRNKFLLPDDGPQPQPTIPILIMNREVY